MPKGGLLHGSVIDVQDNWTHLHLPHHSQECLSWQTKTGLPQRCLSLPVAHLTIETVPLDIDKVRLQHHGVEFEALL